MAKRAAKAPESATAVQPATTASTAMQVVVPAKARPFVRRAHPGMAYPGDDVPLVWSRSDLWNGEPTRPGQPFDRSTCDRAKVRRLWQTGHLQEAEPEPAEASTG